jgi:hypothetical protein
MPSAKRERHRAGREQGMQAAREVTRRPCERCGGRCRAEKPIYGWVCARCADELDRHLALNRKIRTRPVESVYRVYERAKRRGLPPPGSRTSHGSPGLTV